jgi:hypothetical protein
LAILSMLVLTADFNSRSTCPFSKAKVSNRQQLTVLLIFKRYLTVSHIASWLTSHDSSLLQSIHFLR